MNKRFNKEFLKWAFWMHQKPLVLRSSMNAERAELVIGYIAI
jgi:hypothetical protein